MYRRHRKRSCLTSRVNTQFHETPFPCLPHLKVVCWCKVDLYFVHRQSGFAFRFGAEGGRRSAKEVVFSNFSQESGKALSLHLLHFRVNACVWYPLFPLRSRQKEACPEKLLYLKHTLSASNNFP